MEETKTNRDDAKLIFQEVAKLLRISNVNYLVKNLDSAPIADMEQSIELLRVGDMLLKQLERQLATSDDLGVVLNLNLVYERIGATIDTFTNQITYLQKGRPTSSKPKPLITVAQFYEAVKLVERYEKQLSK